MSVFTVRCSGRFEGEAEPRFMLSCYASDTFSPGQCQLSTAEEMRASLDFLRGEGHEILDLDDAAQCAAFVERRDAAYAARRAA